MTTLSFSSRSLFAACFYLPLFAAACGGDEFKSSVPDAPGGQGGTSGSSGQGGGGGLAGSSPAGQGGTVGTPGGSAGQGGGGASAGQGGLGGAAGQGGTAGSGGCPTGEFKCAGDVLQVCSKETKKFEPLETCNAGQCDDQQGKCVTVCKGDEARCQGDNLQLCDKGIYKFSETCKKGLCSETSKACLDCEVGEAKACKEEGGDTQLLCDSAGVPSQEKMCPPDAKFCTGDGSCVKCMVDGDCETPSEPCYKNTCSPEHSCVKTFIEAGKASNDADSASCFIKTCDGQGKLLTTNKEQASACKNGQEDGYCALNGNCSKCSPGYLLCGEKASIIYACSPEDGVVVPIEDCRDSGYPLCLDGGGCMGVVEMGAGNKHTCALTDSGDVYCWGSNADGQLGLGVAEVGNAKNRPQKVTGLPQIKDRVWLL